MKPSLLISILTGLGLVLSAIVINQKPSYAQDRFGCNESQVATTVQTERGEIPLIRWTDNSFPPPYTPLQRCQEISARFKRFDDNGTLKYLKASHQGNYPIICVAAYKGGSCLPDGLLVTLKPGTDPNQTLVKILDRRVWAANGAVELSNGNDNGLVSDVDGETYFNLEGFLNWSNSSASQ